MKEIQPILVTDFLLELNGVYKKDRGFKICAEIKNVLNCKLEYGEKEIKLHFSRGVKKIKIHPKFQAIVQYIIKQYRMMLEKLYSLENVDMVKNKTYQHVFKIPTELVSYEGMNNAYFIASNKTKKIASNEIKKIMSSIDYEKYVEKYW